MQNTIRFTQDGGFTLFEMVAVCFMVGFMATFIHVSIRNSAYLEAAAKKVSGDLISCRDAAVTSGRNVGLYRANSQDYYVRYDSNTSNISYDAVAGKQWHEDMKRWKGVSISGGFQIEFNAYGRTSLNTGPIILTDGSQTRQISVNAQTGYVQIM